MTDVLMDRHAKPIRTDKTRLNVFTDGPLFTVLRVRMELAPTEMGRTQPAGAARFVELLSCLQGRDQGQFGFN
jgi:hypothetical protein